MPNSIARARHRRDHHGGPLLASFRFKKAVNLDDNVVASLPATPPEKFRKAFWKQRDQITGR